MKPRKRSNEGQSSKPSQNALQSSIHQARRSSTRIKNQQNSVTPKFGMTDSAYDADEESVTPNSSPEQQSNIDPYEIDMIEDVPFVKKKTKRKNQSTKTKSKHTTKSAPRQPKKMSSPSTVNTKNVPTSTPVLHSSMDIKSKLHESSINNSLSITPEVTPILPVKPYESASPSDSSFVTPQIRRSTRKRSLQPDISMHQLNSSQGDSGIVVSPVSKKRCTGSHMEKISDELDEMNVKNANHKVEGAVISRSKKETEKSSSKVFGRHYMNQKNIFSPNSKYQFEIYQPEEFSKPAPGSADDSCFGFDSIGSPVFAAENSPPSKPKKGEKTKKLKKRMPAKEVYRVPEAELTDSSPNDTTENLGLSQDSESSQDNPLRERTRSPTLFSDSISENSEIMGFEVNRSSSAAYKPSKGKKLKQKGTVNKLDDWASTFNMEIEDIEKFDLIIE